MAEKFVKSAKLVKLDVLTVFNAGVIFEMGTSDVDEFVFKLTAGVVVLDSIFAALRGTLGVVNELAMGCALGVTRGLVRLIVVEADFGTIDDFVLVLELNGVFTFEADVDGRTCWVTGVFLGRGLIVAGTFVEVVSTFGPLFNGFRVKASVFRTIWLIFGV